MKRPSQDSLSLMRDVYRSSLVLLTDLYQLTMAYGYWKTGARKKEAAFHLFFRKPPFNGGFTIACGLSYVVDFIKQFHFERGDLDYLGTLVGRDKRPLFEEGFLKYLSTLRLTCDVDAIPEGTVVFPHEPLVRVCGPIIEAQLLETALLNFINFQTLIATKAARIRVAAGEDSIMEFGLRRAQGVDGALTASRASFIGGCDSSSNVLAGKLFGIPVVGTHAHSWVMAFDSELEAFEAYAKAMPNNCIFLVDTYDTLEGVKHAIEVGTRLKKQGHQFLGIRLDSGDLAYLSQVARQMLDAAGLKDALIVATNDLDENIIASLKQQESKIAVWGVGTRLITANEQPALGGVYKLSSVRDPGGKWQPKIKLSEQTVKVSTPGIQQVRRYTGPDGFTADLIYDEQTGIEKNPIMIDPLDVTRRRKILNSESYTELLVPVFRKGELVYKVPSVLEAKKRTREQLAGFHSGIKRFVNPHVYPVGLEENLYHLKNRLILAGRGMSESSK